MPFIIRPPGPQPPPTAETGTTRTTATTVTCLFKPICVDCVSALAPRSASPPRTLDTNRALRRLCSCDFGNLDWDTASLLRPSHCFSRHGKAPAPRACQRRTWGRSRACRRPASRDSNNLGWDIANPLLGHVPKRGQVSRRHTWGRSRSCRRPSSRGSSNQRSDIANPQGHLLDQRWHHLLHI